MSQSLQGTLPVHLGHVVAQAPIRVTVAHDGRLPGWYGCREAVPFVELAHHLIRRVRPNPATFMDQVDGKF